MATDSFARTLGLSALGTTDELSVEINNMKNIGRFLALWDCATGLPLTDPITMPYTYKTGDYYRVSNVATGSGTNYKPNGATYNHVASTTVETGAVAVGWIYYYDGSTWVGQGGSGGDAVHYTEDTGKTAIEKAQARANINAQEVLPDAVAGKYLHANATTGALEWSGAEAIFRFSTMPTASAAYNGMIAQYIGTTDSTYTSGYFYKCNGTSWVQINVQPSGGSSGDVIEIEYLTNGAMTLAQVNTLLNEINTAGRHVMFDTSTLGASMYLCTIYIDSYSNPTVFRVEDKVTGKINIGAYDATLTLAQIMQGAVEDFVNIIVTCTTNDGVTVTGQTVTLRQGASATSPVYATKSYNGQPITFIVPKNFAYFASVSDTLAQHFAPTTATGIAATNTNVTLTYQDLSSITNYEGIAAALQALDDPSVLIGNVTIADTWTDENGTVYQDPTSVMAIKTVEDEDGNTHTAAIMQRNYAVKNSMQFDAPEKLVATGTYQSGLYYYRNNSGTITLLVEGTDYQVGDEITGTVYVNSIRDTSKNIINYGYNNYKLSGIRQYLNSEAGIGLWWQSQHTGDVAPSQAATTRGYLAGCSTALKNAAKTIKISCNSNTVTDGGVVQTMYDKVWLPSGTEMFGSVNSDEGSYFPLVKTRMGEAVSTNAANAGRIYYNIANHSSASLCWVRSAYRSYSYGVWFVVTSGQLSNYYGASTICSCAPAFAIY